MRYLVIALFAVVPYLIPSEAAAQRRVDSGVTFALARHGTDGGMVSSRTATLIDVLADVRGSGHRHVSALAAFGAGMVIGSTVSGCQLREDGSCAPNANFVILNALVGLSSSFGHIGARALVGPALYRGAGDTSFGVQGRIDGVVPVAKYFNPGVMLRATVLPSHGGSRLTLWAVGASLAL